MVKNHLRVFVYVIICQFKKKKNELDYEISHKQFKLAAPNHLGLNYLPLWGYAFL